MSYSTDLREAVLRYLESGGRVLEAAELFEISRSSIQRWRVRKNEIGSPAIKARTPGPYKIKDDELKDYVARHPDAYLSEIAAHFSVTDSGIFRALERLNITRKKRPHYMKSEMIKSD